MIRAVPFVIIVLLVVTSCHKLESGVVVQRWVEPEQDIMMFMPISTGKSTILVPYWVHDDTDYCVRIHGTDADGEERTETYYLGAAQFDTMTVGRMLCVKGLCDEDPNEEINRK